MAWDRTGLLFPPLDDVWKQVAASAVWADVLAVVADRSHLATGDQLSAMVDDAVALLGLRAEVLMVNLAQRALVMIRPGRDERVDVEGTLAGRAFQLGELVESIKPHGERVLWVPMLDGTERVGVVRLSVDAAVVDDAVFRARCWSLAGMVGHIVMITDRLQRPAPTAAQRRRAVHGVGAAVATGATDSSERTTRTGSNRTASDLLPAIGPRPGLSCVSYTS